MAIKKVTRYEDSSGHVHLTEEGALVAEEKIVFVNKVDKALGITRYRASVCPSSLKKAAAIIYYHRKALAEVFDSREW